MLLAAALLAAGGGLWGSLPRVPPALAAPRGDDSSPPLEAPRALFIAEPHVDFGDVPDDVLLIHKFTFTNISDHTVRLTFGCGGYALPCTDKDRYRPGESGTITVTVNPAGRNGPFTRVISALPVAVPDSP
jgi:hypothetical protein